MKKKTALLILLLVVTAIPAVGFVGLSSIIVSTALSVGGNVQIFVSNDMLEVQGMEGGMWTSFSVYVGLFISFIVFLLALFLLIHGWQNERRKKHALRNSYTV